MTEPDIYDFDILARTVYGEARGEPMEGKIAVARVVVNRWLHATDQTLEAVCKKPFQFSCWNSTDPNEPKIRAVGYEDPVLRECMIAGLTAMNLKPEQDPTMGARHYCTLSATPEWIQGRHPTVNIGRHQFFAGIK